MSISKVKENTIESRNRQLKKKFFSMNEKAIRFERMKLVKEAYEKYKRESPGIRYAYIFRHVLSHMSIIIDEDDLVVGRIKEIVPNDEEENIFLEEAHKDKFDQPTYFSFDSFKLGVPIYPGARFSPEWFNAWGHIVVSWENLLNEGFLEIKKQAENQLANVKGNKEKEEFLKSVSICSDGVIALSKRYADKAGSLAEKEENLSRKEELQQIEKVCNRVPAKPARNFHEALQAVWFIHFINSTVCGARDYGFGRFDQYMYPFYEKSLSEKFTNEKALELLECFFIKCNEISGQGMAHYSPKRVQSVDSVQYLVIGGQNKDGEDASNPISHLCLKAANDVRLKQPTLVVRYFKGINKNFWYEVCKLTREGLGYPMIYNDETVIPSLIGLGVSPEDAKNYAHYGCCNPTIPGKEGTLRECWHPLPKYLELALNNGFCPMTGRKMGPSTGTTSELKTFEDLLKALRIQMRHGIDNAIKMCIESDEKLRQTKPFSFESCLVEGCIENGEDCEFGGGTYLHSNQHGVGIATLADSLCVIRKLVYEDKEITLSQLKEILNKNYKGQDNLRFRFLNEFPKFGNDNGYVDSLAAEAGKIFCEEVLKYKNSKRTPWPSFYSLWHENELGENTGATPDGRRACEPFSENQSPGYGRDTKGPTALLNSLSKLPFNMTPGGGLNILLHPTLVKGEKGISCLSNLLKGYFDNGGEVVMINVVDKNTLIDAQKHPDKYRSLLIRLVGWSVYFVTLPPAQQEQIIRRTEMGA